MNTLCVEDRHRIHPIGLQFTPNYVCVLTHIIRLRSDFAPVGSVARSFLGRIMMSSYLAAMSFGGEGDEAGEMKRNQEGVDDNQEVAKRPAAATEGAVTPKAAAAEAGGGRKGTQAEGKSRALKRPAAAGAGQGGPMKRPAKAKAAKHNDNDDEDAGNDEGDDEGGVAADGASDELRDRMKSRRFHDLWQELPAAVRAEWDRVNQTFFFFSYIRCVARVSMESISTGRQDMVCKYHM